MGEPFVCVNGIDLDAAETWLLAEMEDPHFDMGVAMEPRAFAERLIEQALGECIPATVETKGGFVPIDYAEQRFVSAWQPVKGDQ